MSFTCGDESNGGFDCQDPDAPCVDEDDDIILLPEYDDDSTGRTTSFDCVPGYIADGICDDVNNDAICGGSRSLTVDGVYSLLWLSCFEWPYSVHFCLSCPLRGSNRKSARAGEIIRRSCIR